MNSLKYQSRRNNHNKNNNRNNNNRNNNNNNLFGGDGYSVNPAVSIAGQPEIDRYSYSDLVLPTCTSTATKQTGGFGQMLFSNFIAELNNLLAPLGMNALSSLVVLLGFKLLSDRKMAKKVQRGGALAGLTSVLLPMGKENLVTLASLLLIQYFLVNRSVGKKIKSLTKRGRKPQKGGFGAPFMAELNTLLAPLGLSALGASIVLLFLNDVLSKKSGSGSVIKRRGRRMMKGGSIISQFTNIIAPSGVEMFTISAVLMILQRLFSQSLGRSSKNSQRGGFGQMMFSGLLNELNQLLMPLGAVPFATTLSLLLLYKLYNRPSSGTGLVSSTYGLGKKIVKGTYGVGKKAVTGTYGVGKKVVTGTYGVGKKAVTGTYGVGKKAVTGTYGVGKKVVTGTYGVGKKVVKGTYGVAKKVVGKSKKLVKRTKRTRRTRKSTK